MVQIWEEESILIEIVQAIGDWKNTSDQTRASKKLL